MGESGTSKCVGEWERVHNHKIDTDMQKQWVCNRGGHIGSGWVEAAKIAKHMALLYEMEEKYPGLFDILRDPYGSLYLHEGMYELALQFLEDYVEKMANSRYNFYMRKTVWKCI